MKKDAAHRTRRRLQTSTNVVLFLCLLVPAHADLEDLPILASPDSLSAYKTLLRGDPKDAGALAKLGHAYLALDSLALAQRYFVRSIKYGKCPSAYYGLGLCYWFQAKYHHQVIMAFRIEPNFRNAIERDPSFSPAYLALAERYRDGGWPDKLIGYLETYTSLHPDELNGRYRMALAHIENEDYASALGIAEKTLLEDAGGCRWLPLAAQGYAARGDFDRSLTVWRQYLSRIGEDLRAVYQDLSCIATPIELEGLAATELDSTLEMEAFWRKRDVTMISSGKGREAEHYRRVWYSMNFLSEKKGPWDLRGDVYIRYGKPAYRSRSGQPNAPPPNAAYWVKWRLAEGILGGELGPNGIGNAFPTCSSVPNPKWESWVYTALGRHGTEFVFVDEFHNGRWQWPGMPPGLNPISQGFHPGILYNDIAVNTPDYFDVPPGYDPLEFYYTTATFRGEDGQTDANVYFGIPPGTEASALDKTQVTRVRRVAVLGTRDRDIVDRSEEELAFTGAPDAQEGTFFPDLASLTAAPGAYRLSVAVSDRASGRWGVYLQDLDLPDYTGRLAVSDVVVAFEAGEVPGAEMFHRGGILVMPMPSRSFRYGQHPSFYYEIYNLMTDEFGRTSYLVEYEIRRHRLRRGAATVARVIGAALSSLLSSRRPTYQVGYDRNGEEEWEPVYFELGTDKVEPGVNMLTVRVTDLNSGVSAESEAIFRLDARVK